MTPLLQHQPKTAGRRAAGGGLTLVELLVALVVSSVILSAVATLAFAMTSAADATDDTSRKQAQLRYATLRLSELIRHCRLVCGTPGDALAFWRADDNDDGQININEIAYISAGPHRNHIRLYECNSNSNPTVELSKIDSVGTSWWLGFYDIESYTELIPQCSNVEFYLHLDDEHDPVTKARCVSIMFKLSENNIDRLYQMQAALHCWAGHLLNDDGTAIVSDDD
jgi:prepilin-type N-terminal cleavage/methylation domain-containing protein